MLRCAPARRAAPSSRAASPGMSSLIARASSSEAVVLNSSRFPAAIEGNDRAALLRSRVDGVVAATSVYSS